MVETINTMLEILVLRQCHMTFWVLVAFTNYFSRVKVDYYSLLFLLVFCFRSIRRKCWNFSIFFITTYRCGRQTFQEPLALTRWDKSILRKLCLTQASIYSVIILPISFLMFQFNLLQKPFFFKKNILIYW